MVYASVPAYLDPPNWNQQQHQHHQQPHQAGGSTSTGVGGGGGGGSEANPLLPPVQARPDGGLPATVRPISMADRARQAKVPQPEAALKCPRCDSSNTKFCYFNNYSLSQPRHFCKTCRRYWTRGGALRNVPVGGGCRRNKRSKSSSNSKSSSSTTPTLAGHGGAIGTSNLAPPPNHPFMGSLSDYGAHNIGLNYGGIQSIDPVEYQVGNSSASMGLEQWRLQQLQQIPFFAELEHQAPQPSLGLYPFEAVEGGVDGAGGFSGQARGKATAAGLISQLASVKMEENQQRLNLSRQYMGIGGNDHHYNWGTTGGGGGGGGNTTNGGGGGGGGGWTGLSGFNTSSTGNLL